jgi:predicted DNA-binding protein
VTKPTKPTTIRLPEDLLERLDRRARERGKDRATYIREFLHAGLASGLEEEVVAQYRDGRLSLSEAARRLGLDAWEWFDRLRRHGESINVELEDWVDSRRSL